MATVTLYATYDGFKNNISGWYPSEGFNLSRNTSSSNGDFCDAYQKFTTVGSGIGASDTINSVTFYWNVYSWSDINSVSQWLFYTDTNAQWDSSGTWNDTTPPYDFPDISYGTNYDGAISIGSTGWNNKSITTSIPKSGTFSIGIRASLGDVGPGLMYYYDNSGGANSPYVVIDYTPASSAHLLSLTGVGK